MKILTICGSPRAKGNSEHLLAGLQERLAGNEIASHKAPNDSAQVVQSILKDLPGSDALVISFPLYVDGIPSNLLGVLTQIEREIAGKQFPLKVYAIVNNGFYDARQNALAIAMIRNWCGKCALQMGYAVGVGGGEMSKAAPLGKGPLTSIGKALDALSRDITEKISRDDVFVEPNFPRPLYKIAAHIGWKKQAKSNGITPKDILKQRTLN